MFLGLGAVSPVSPTLPFAAFTVAWALLGRYDLDLCYLVHALGAVILGLVSVFSPHDRLDIENVLVRYSFGYFLGHGFEMIRQKQCTITMGCHHVLALTLLFGVLLNPEFVEVKATSNVLLTEFSTIFLYAWEKHPSETALTSFVISYFVSRGVYLGYFVVRVFTTQDPSDIASRIPIGVFHHFTLLLFVLNALYFSRILVPSVPGHFERLGKIKQSRPRM